MQDLANQPLTEEMIKQEMAKYPEWVSFSIKVEIVPFGGVCRHQGWGRYQIEAGFVSTFHHEMGHAVTDLFKIRQELGEIVMSFPDAQVVDNSNPYVYGARMLRREGLYRAIDEYAADAVMHYQLGQAEPEVKEFLDQKFAEWTL